MVDDQIAIRRVTQLSLSFDHRNIDGQGASEFLADLAYVLTNPEIICWHMRSHRMAQRLLLQTEIAQDLLVRWLVI